MAGIGKHRKGRIRDREIKKRGIRKYGQATLKHSRKGTYSCWYASGALLFTFLGIWGAFRMHGEAAGYIGGLGMMAMILSVLGIRAGARGLREREKRYLFCRLGIAANGLLLLSLSIIFIGGVMK